MHIKKHKKKRKDKPGRDKKPAGSPVQHFTNTTRALFLDVMKLKGNVTHAAAVVGVTRQACYQERRRNEVFAKGWDDSLQVAYDVLEAEAWRRAVQGTDKPVYQKGMMVGTVREYSDKLMVVLLRAARPLVGVDDSIKELQQERLVVEKALNDPQLLKHLRAVDERVKVIECTVGEPRETVIEQRKD